jgi:hypothetical protein
MTPEEQYEFAVRYHRQWKIMYFIIIGTLIGAVIAAITILTVRVTADRSGTSPSAAASSPDGDR